MFKGNWWDKTLAWVLTLAFMVMVGSTILQVISRYIFRYPLGWTEELAMIMFIWSMFISVAILAKNNKLMSVDFFLGLVPERARGLILAPVYALSAAAMGFLGWQGVRLLGQAQGQLSAAMNIPYPVIYAALPVGCLLAALYLAVHAAQTVRGVIGGQVVARGKEEQSI